MAISTSLADVGFLLCRTAAVSASNVLLLLSFGAHFPIGRCVFAFRSPAECDSVEDNVIYVIACKLVHCLMSLVYRSNELGINGGIGEHQ